MLSTVPVVSTAAKFQEPITRRTRFPDPFGPRSRHVLGTVKIVPPEGTPAAPFGGAYFGGAPISFFSMGRTMARTATCTARNCKMERASDQRAARTDVWPRRYGGKIEERWRRRNAVSACWWCVDGRRQLFAVFVAQRRRPLPWLREWPLRIWPRLRDDDDDDYVYRYRPKRSRYKMLFTREVSMRPRHRRHFSPRRYRHGYGLKIRPYYHAYPKYSLLLLTFEALFSSCSGRFRRLGACASMPVSSIAHCTQ